ncbi:gamma-aminobutyric acid type B receptor subunit 1 [Oopsacas minuta]|uniref:Gamma-aminobutyric acid type B receptor subunit 1 n=1 Tax=Oopsacas minuta TaxID=111878 RepID=A0AAV7KJT0_9METZ|nr:gamma-aminobutyric acid type B receptor subunit 1 [Oopsacas minuta]
MGNIKFAFVLIALLVSTERTDQQVLNIAAVYPYPSTGFSGATPAAVKLALNHINSNPTILPNYSLTVKFRDSGCKEKIAVRSLFKFISEPNENYLVVLGAWCSKATDVVAELALAYDKPVISWASTSPSFTNSELYPELLLGTPSDINTVSGQLVLIQELKIRRVAIINEQEDLFVTISARLHVFLNELGVEYLTEIYNPESQNYLQTIDLILTRIHNDGYNVIVLNGREEEYVQIMCRLKNFPSLHPPATTWIILGWYVNWSDDVEGYTNGDCNFDDIVAVTSGSIAVNPTVGFEEFDLDKQKTISGYTPKELNQMYESLVTQENDADFFENQRNFYDVYAYDCTWTIALALNELSAKYDLNREPLESEELFDSMQRVTFHGWGGDVMYLERIRQESRIQIYEVINASFQIRGLYENVPFNHSELVGNGNINYIERAPFTIFNPDLVSDGIEPYHIHTSIFALTVIFSLLGTTYVTVLIVIISVGWIKKYAAVTKSEPSVNIVIISGNYFIFVLALLWSIDGRYIDVSDNQPVCTFVCHLRVWLFAVSISIIFGGMLGKAIKYYVIAIKHKFKYSTYLNFYQILLIPVILVVIDTIYVLMWSLSSPITYNTIIIDSGLENPPLYMVSECRAGNQTKFVILLTIFLIYKSILVVVGLFLAYHLRKVVNKANKYSSTITWTMYNVGIFSIVQIVLVLTLTNVDVKYGLVGLSTIVEGFVISSIVAGPIIYYLFKDPYGKTFRPLPGRATFPENPDQLKEKIRTLEGQNSILREKMSKENSVVTKGVSLENSAAHD